MDTENVAKSSSMCFESGWQLIEFPRGKEARIGTEMGKTLTDHPRFTKILL